MPDNRPAFHVLAVGWDHPAWQGSFYPDDLPADWRLTYYANEVPGVLLFIEGERMDMAVLKNLHQLAQLLGLA